MHIKKPFTPRFIFLMFGMTIVGVASLSILWEFQLETIVVSYLHPHLPPESLYERMEYVITAIIVATIAMIVPGWIVFHALSEQQRAIDKIAIADDKLRESERRLNRLSLQLIVEQEQERSEIARELHDNVIQTLAALNFIIESLWQRINDNSRNEFIEIKKEILPAIQTSIKELRNIYMDLLPNTLEDFGIIPTINWVCRRIKENNKDTTINTRLDEVEEHIPHSRKVCIFRIIQDYAKLIAYKENKNRLDMTLGINHESLIFSLKDSNSRVGEESDNEWEAELTLISMERIEKIVEQSGGIFSYGSSQTEGFYLQAEWLLSDENYSVGSIVTG